MNISVMILHQLSCLVTGTVDVVKQSLSLSLLYGHFIYHRSSIKPTRELISETAEETTSNNMVFLCAPIYNLSIPFSFSLFLILISFLLHTIGSSHKV